MYCLQTPKITVLPDAGLSFDTMYDGPEKVIDITKGVSKAVFCVKKNVYLENVLDPEVGQKLPVPQWIHHCLWRL